MAIRKRPDRASSFQVFWNNPFTGKRESKSFNTLGEAKKHDALVKYQLKFERENFAGEEERKEDSGVVTLESLCYLYLKSKKPSKANATRLLGNLKPILSRFGNVSPEEITRQQLTNAMQEMRNRGNSSSTVRVRFAHLKAILRWGVDMGMLSSCPDFRIPKAEPERIPPPSPEEAARIIRYAPEHIQRVIMLGISLGVRVGPSEMFTLKWEDFDMRGGFVRVWSAKKNPKAPWRDIPLKKSIIPLLQEWREKDALTPWVIHFKGEQVKSIKTAWRKSLLRAGISRRIRPYDLRHAFATEALSAGADIRTVSELMGHTDITMVLKHYQHVLDRQKQAAVDAIPDIPICAQEYVPKN